MPNARPSRRKFLMLTIFALFLAPLIARAALYAAGNGPRSWRDADWSSTGMLPPAGESKPARVIVFTGTAGAWKGIFAVHSWIVLKRENAPGWTRYDVVGWGRDGDFGSRRAAGRCEPRRAESGTARLPYRRT